MERAASASGRDGGRRLGLPLLIGGLTIASVAAAIVGNGNPAVAIAPWASFVLLYALFKLPLRVPALMLFAAPLVLEVPAEGFCQGRWSSPFAILGELLYGQLKKTIPVSALVFTGQDVLLALLFAIHFYRRATGSTIDKVGAVPVPRPFIYAAWAVLAGCAFAWVWGLSQGGSFRFSLWQVQRVIYIPLMFFLLSAALPHARFYEYVGRIIIWAACLRAVLAIVLRAKFPEVQYTTTHADSMLFAVATCIPVIAWIEQRSRKNLTIALLVLPLLVFGMIANDRRLVWVELGLSLLFVFIYWRRTRLKVQIIRGLLVSIPVVLAYIAVGWTSASKIFAPARMVRSIFDSKSDSSTEWRDLENFNLVATIKNNPVVGSGWGIPFEEVIKLPDVTDVYELEPYAPHNSVLGIWAYTGYVGFALHWMTLLVTVYFALRNYRMATQSRDRVACLICLCAVVTYMVHLYGDLALGTWVSVMFISSSMVIMGKLAVTIGAWPGKRTVVGQGRGPRRVRVEQVDDASPAAAQ